MPDAFDNSIKLALPKGRMEKGVQALLADAGVVLRASSRGYRPEVLIPGSPAPVSAKILKPQNIIEMLHAGSRDIGFAGADWVAELDADLVELMDTGLDVVRLVAAAPPEVLDRGRVPQHSIVVASEYERLTKRWITSRNLDARYVRSFGATEVFPPEDADCIVDVAATGATLVANGLEVFDQLLTSSTRLYANPAALGRRETRELADRLVLLLGSVLEARKRVMLEVNVPREKLEAVCRVIPCMREPTISPLHAESGYAVKAAVPREQLPKLIPDIKSAGGTDIVVSPVAQIVP
ncbi:MAG: ATP phosphoribosyltransferase [Phycisphaerales bacterium]|nr:ATP phosphoribosyltransferase [Phycisphaerales bacterium]